MLHRLLNVHRPYGIWVCHRNPVGVTGWIGRRWSITEPPLKKHDQNQWNVDINQPKLTKNN